MIPFGVRQALGIDGGGRLVFLVDEDQVCVVTPARLANAMWAKNTAAHVGAETDTLLRRLRQDVDESVGGCVI